MNENSASTLTWDTIRQAQARVGLASSALFSPQIIESVHCVEDGEPYERKRGWRERWFSRPWRPFKKTATVVPKVPMQGGYRMGDKIVMHPATAAKVRAQLFSENND